MKRLDGRVALVTGGERGLGAAIIQEFAGEGASCVVNYPTEKEQDRATVVADSARSVGGEALAYQCDVSDWHAVHDMVKTIMQEFGRIDILVNNAGINTLRTWEEMDRESWDATISVNLTGVFNCCKAVLDPMKSQNRGNIINMSSIASYIGRGNVDYISSKNALLGLTRSLARQYGPHGIRANAIAPGFHNTDMVKRAMSVGSENAEEFINMVPLRIFPEADSIGKAALFLAADDSYFITGHTLVVDGGLTLR